MISPSQDAPEQENDVSTARLVAEAPPHMCFNEIVVSPTWNRMIVGGADLQLAPKAR